jgi:hypothetical protein
MQMSHDSFANETIISYWNAQKVLESLVGDLDY